jgi:hypothetical protein
MGGVVEWTVSAFARRRGGRFERRHLMELYAISFQGICQKCEAEEENGR